MKVTLITHSCVLIELTRQQLLFDYFGQGDLSLDHGKPLYIFCSHHHSDHYSDAIFTIDHPQKKYILADDIPPSHQAFLMKPCQTKALDDLAILTLRSTDEGVAYVIRAEDKIIYFAGDLNDWHWDEENEQDRLDNVYQYNAYRQEMRKLKGLPIDIAFIPVDDRLEDHYTDGLITFDQMTTTRYLFPIHYFGHYTISQKLASANLKLKGKLILPDHDGFTLEGL